MRLSKNFKIEEFAVSAQYPALAAAIEFTAQDCVKAQLLALLFLQPVRDEYGKVTILSGKRTADLNEFVGGSATSDHLYTPGTTKAAVDFTCEDVPGAFRFLKMRGPFAFGQLIHYAKSNFIHVSLPTEKHTGEAIEWEK